MSWCRFIEINILNIIDAFTNTGTHKELAEKDGGIYAALVQSQKFKEEEESGKKGSTYTAEVDETLASFERTTYGHSIFLASHKFAYVHKSANLQIFYLQGTNENGSFE